MRTMLCETQILLFLSTSIVVIELMPFLKSGTKSFYAEHISIIDVNSPLK